MVSKSGIETPDFNRIKQFKDFELRDYGSIIIATTTLEEDNLIEDFCNVNSRI